MKKFVTTNKSGMKKSVDMNVYKLKTVILVFLGMLVTVYVK